MKHHSCNIKNIFFKAFFGYTALIVALIGIVLSVFQYLQLRKNINHEIEQTSSVIADSIDLQVMQMDSVALNIINSTVITDTFSSLSDDEEQTPYETMSWQNTLSSELYAVKGMNSSLRQINLYALNGTGYGIGDYIGDFEIDLSEEPWYEKTVEADGKLYSSYSIDNILSSESASSEKQYFSLYRLYFDTFNNPCGIVEIMIYYDTLFESAEDPGIDYNFNIIIYDSDGTQIYPISKNSSQDYDYFSAGQTGKIRNNETNRIEHVYSTETDYSGYTIYTIVDNQSFLAPIFRSLLFTALSFALIFLFSGCIAGLTSRKLSAPLTQIYGYLSDTKAVSQYEELQMDYTGIIEIDKLKDSLNQAVHEQKESAEIQVHMKEQELHAQMLAMQAQMNPHFIYNSLNTIRAMNEEGMTDSISKMCNNITSILRYICSSKEQQTSLEEELEYCNEYLSCIKMRYGDSFSYNFEIPDKMLDLFFPKLSVQMLIENSVKYTTCITGPWQILISGQTDSEKYFIEVSDNGIGFNSKTLQNLKEQMSSILETGNLPNMDLGGMGLLNIFIRFYLIYGNHFIFDIQNHERRGSSVKIGAYYDEKKSEKL